MREEMNNEKYHDYQNYIEQKRDLEKKQKEYDENIKNIIAKRNELENSKSNFQNKYGSKYPKHITQEEYNQRYGKKKRKNFLTILIIIVYISLYFFR